MSPATEFNNKPIVIPALRKWCGGAGFFEISKLTRIVVDSEHVLLGREFQSEVEEFTGLSLELLVSDIQFGDGTGETSAKPFHNAIHLVCDPFDRSEEGRERYASEGYRLAISETAVLITAPTGTGLFYGTRTVLQIVAQSELNNSLPAGEAVDWPDYEVRGFMLDMGRRFFTAVFIKDYIRLMSFFKLNRFQLHLSDNEFSGEGGDWSKAYSCFRLRSDNPDFAGLAAPDGSYDRATWEEFEDIAEMRGVTLVPEIDGPAHAAAIIQWRPDIGLDGGNSDHLDLSNPESTRVMKEILSEFMPWFRSPDVNFGADEYPRNLADDYRNYFNAMAGHIRALGKQPSAWGSFSYMGDLGADGYDKDVVINSWNNEWYGLETAAADGMKFINMNDATLYVVPFAKYYHGGGLDNEALFADWLPTMGAKQQVQPEQVMGAMFAVWNDLVRTDYSALDVHGLIATSFAVIAQKTWAASKPKTSYGDFETAVRMVGMGPGLVVVPREIPAVPAEPQLSRP